MLFVSGSEPGRREPQHRNVVEAARDAGVALLAYTSVLGGPEADFVLAADHKATEQAILDAGVPYTFLRNGFYHEVYTETIPQALERGAVTASAGDGRIATASRADYAAAAVAVLTGEGHEGRAYERGLLTRTSDDLRQLIGRPPTPLAEAITSALKD